MMQQQQFVQSPMPPNPNQLAQQMGGMQLHEGVKSPMPPGSFPVNGSISPAPGNFQPRPPMMQGPPRPNLMPPMGQFQNGAGRIKFVTHRD